MSMSTEGRTITEADIVFFSYFSGDWTYLHTDAAAAEKSSFGKRVAHGYLTLSVSLGLLVRAGLVNGKKFVALKSIDSVRFSRPVGIGDTLHVIFSQKTSAITGGKREVITSGKTLNQGGDVVMEFQTTHLERR